MNNEKKAPVLTLENIAPYIPHGLRVAVGKNERNLTAVSLDSPFVFVSAWKGSREKEMVSIVEIKPILRPLSEYKDINSKSMNDLNTDLEIQMEICDLANKKISFHSLSYGTAKECFANHIDIFGLIEKGLAIDINSIEGKETNS